MSRVGIHPKARTGLRPNAALLLAFVAGIGLTSMIYENRGISLLNRSLFQTPTVATKKSLQPSTTTQKDEAASSSSNGPLRTVAPKSSKTNETKKTTQKPDTAAPAPPVVNKKVSAKKPTQKSSLRKNSTSTTTTTNTESTLGSRMQYYRERYRYRKPTPHDDFELPCGEGPNFEEYFELGKFNRSRLNEDLVIYQNFFKSLYSNKGVFVEMGAFNGMKESNSRFYDECLQWEGLLVEPNPLMTKSILESRPHAHKLFYAPSCTREEEAANHTISFHATKSTMATVDGIDEAADATTLVEVPCGTLTDPLLDLLGGQTINFFSLDVEGAEPLILRNLDLDRVRVNIFMVESLNRMCEKGCDSRLEVRRILVEKYQYVLFPDVVSKSDLYLHPTYYQEDIPQEWKDQHQPETDLESTPPIPQGSLKIRLKEYKERYQHRKPQSKRDQRLSCGNKPSFPDFFKLDSTDRSGSDEDWTVYNTFFRNRSRKGVYLETGAFDGVTESNTRFFDECLGWDGLVIETNPLLSKTVIKNRPNAHKMFYSPTCNATQEKKLVKTSVVVGKNGETVDDVPCGTVTNVLMDLFPNRRINFFSLNTGGGGASSSSRLDDSLVLLQNLDLHKVSVDVLIAENLCQDKCPSREAIRRIMLQDYNYVLYPTVVTRSDLFIHPEVHDQMPMAWTTNHTSMALTEVEALL